MSEVWAKWEGQVINGVFPLRRLLGVSDHSGVFLSDYKARNLPDTAIKLIPANATGAEAQLAQWRPLPPSLIRAWCDSLQWAAASSEVCSSSSSSWNTPNRICRRFFPSAL